MSVLPTESNISMVGVGLLGRTTSGAGKSSRLNAASVRSLCSVYSTSEVDALLAGYQPLDSDLTAIAALPTTSFGRSLLTQADAAAVRSTIGAGTSSFDGAFGSLSGVPTTISGYGITNAYTKTEVDNLVAGLLDFKGNQDCSTNPNYPSASKGDAYYCSVAGKIGGASGVTVAVGDLIVCSADNAGGDQASVGSSWFVLEKNLDGALVSSNNLSDLENAATARSNLGLGTLATQSGTFSGTSSGTNTGDQSVFGTIAVSGQSNVVADQPNDTLTLVAGTNITITTDASTDTITIAGSGGGSPGGSSGQLQFNNAGSFGGTAAAVYAATGTHLVVTAQSATAVPLCVKGAASQTGNHLEVQNSSGTILCSVSSAGNLRLFRSAGTDVIEFDRNSSTSGRILARASTASNPGSGLILDVNNIADLVSYSGGSPNSYFRAAAQPQVYEAGALTGIWYLNSYWSWTHRTTTPATWGDRPALYSRSVGSVTQWHMMDSAGNVLVLDPRAIGTDNSATSGHTRFFLWDVDKGALSRVTVGAADSGGTGYKLLRVPN